MPFLSCRTIVFLLLSFYERLVEPPILASTPENILPSNDSLHFFAYLINFRTVRSTRLPVRTWYRTWKAFSPKCLLPPGPRTLEVSNKHVCASEPTARQETPFGVISAEKNTLVHVVKRLLSSFEGCQRSDDQKEQVRFCSFLSRRLD